MNIGEKAEILVKALPYIQKYRGQIVVIKYGGSVMTDENAKQSVMEDIALLSQVGIRVVLVHGGGPEINEFFARLQIKTEFINGLRRTGKEEAELIQMILSGKVSKDIVRRLGCAGARAIALSGVDDKLIQAQKISDDLGYVGKITHFNTAAVVDMLDKGIVPVISSIGCDDDGNIYNINADMVASYLASELHARSLIALTDTKGILRNKDDESSLIPSITVEQGLQLMREGVISGGMIPKINCCIEAVKAGVHKVFVIDGRLPHAILIEILSDEGSGTMITL